VAADHHGPPELTDPPIAVASWGISAATGVAQKVLDPGAIHASRERRIPVVRHHHDAFGIHLEDADDRHDQAGVLHRGDAEVGDQHDVVRFSRASRVISESCEVVSATTSSERGAPARHERAQVSVVT